MTNERLKEIIIDLIENEFEAADLEYAMDLIHQVMTDEEMCELGLNAWFYSE